MPVEPFGALLRRAHALDRRAVRARHYCRTVPIGRSRRAGAAVALLLTLLLIACACAAPETPTSGAENRTPVKRRDTNTTAGHGGRRGARDRADNTGPRRAATNVYGHTLAGMWQPATKNVPYLIYSPDSGGNSVYVIDPNTYKVVRSFPTGDQPQHVVPSWDLRTLYATNDVGNSLTPIDPRTGQPAGPNIPVDDPYNMYFTPDGKHAIVVEEAHQLLTFRDPHTFAVQKKVGVDCAGVDHMDFSADGSYLIASCEFAGRMVRIDLRKLAVAGYLDIGGSPQDVKLSPDGRTFYVADMMGGGVDLIDAATFKKVGFIQTGQDAHGLYVSRDTRQLYVTNRRGHSISVIDFATRKVVATWNLGQATPDMGNISPDGKVLWLGGRYTSQVYAISTTDGHIIASIVAGKSPHGLCVWPEPGRYSTGHTGVMR